MKFKTLIYNASKIIYPCFFTVYQFEAMYNCSLFSLSSPPPYLLWLHLCYIILDRVWVLELRMVLVFLSSFIYSQRALCDRELYDFMWNEQSQAKGPAR